MHSRLYKSALLLLAALMVVGSATCQRLMNRQRADLGLTRVAPLENAPPMLAFTTVALGGFRGIIANALWIRADKLQAESALELRRAELADLGGRIDDQVRTAFYNLKSSSELVAVAQSNIELANETVVQAQDRLSAGVANNLEVVQAQESVAAANQSYIASVYAFNLAKISLAQILGVAERSAVTYLLGRQ